MQILYALPAWEAHVSSRGEKKHQAPEPVSSTGMYNASLVTTAGSSLAKALPSCAHFAVCVSQTHKKGKRKPLLLEYKWNCQNKSRKTKCFDRDFRRTGDKESRNNVSRWTLSWAPEKPGGEAWAAETKTWKQKSSWKLLGLCLKMTLASKRWLWRGRKPPPPTPHESLALGSHLE